MICHTVNAGGILNYSIQIHGFIMKGEATRQNMDIFVHILSSKNKNG